MVTSQCRQYVTWTNQLWLRSQGQVTTGIIQLTKEFQFPTKTVFVQWCAAEMGQSLFLGVKWFFSKGRGR